LRRTARRALVAAALLAALGVLLAPAAGADGVSPSNYTSVIDAVQPDPDVVRIEVVGGDSFLQVTAEPGTTVEIPGYDGEPYLRIDADGTVQENANSPSTLLNASRSGDVGRLPDEVSSSAEPEWRTVAEGGRIAWHDHRIHWMLDEAPDVGTDGLVQDWELPLVVDGEDVVVTGRLLHLDDELPWAALVAALVTAAALWAGRRHARRPPLLVAAAVVATVLSLAVWLTNPPGAQASPLPLMLCGVALVCALGASLWRGAAPAVRDLGLPLASAASLIGWVVPQVGVLWMPTVPSLLAAPVVRVGTAAVLGLALGTAIAVLVWPVRAERAAPPGHGAPAAA
jgi:hypothetical protein